MLEVSSLRQKKVGDPEIKLPSLQQLTKLENLKLGYKVAKGLVPPKIAQIISHDKNNKSLEKTHRYHTRTKQNLNIPKHVTSTYHKSFLVSVIRDYASLPHLITSINSYQSFVNQCKKHLSKS